MTPPRIIASNLVALTRQFWEKSSADRGNPRQNPTKMSPITMLTNTTEVLTIHMLGVMRAVLAICILLVLSIPAFCADHKYGFTAESDAALLARVRDPEISAVILGCVHRYVPPTEKGSKTHISYVTVIESYKGKLAVGEKTVIVIYAEEGPTEAQEIGTLRFYLLTKQHPENADVPAGGFTCEWTDSLSYARYGEPLRQLLRTQRKPRK